MQTVILAAGRGTRMKELTDGTPKSLLEVAGRPLLEYALDALPERISEVIIVVGYLGGVIHDRFGGEYYGRKILYAEQGEQHGTAGALWSAKEVLKDRFLVLNGDDIYAQEDLSRMTKARDWAMLVAEVESLEEGGRIITDKKERITDIVEGKHDGTPGLASAGAYILDDRIFSYPLVPKAPDSPEYGLPQTALVAADALKIPLEAIPATSWIQITSPEDLKKAEALLKNDS